MCTDLLPVVSSHFSENGLERFKLWCSFNEERALEEEIRQIIKNNEFIKLERAMTECLKFGTSGIRLLMGPGFGRINCLTVTLAAQGLSEYFLSKSGEPSTTRIAISYDGRHGSKKYAYCICSVLLQMKIKVVLFKHVPTPVLAFYVAHNKLQGGIMVTASHNPKEYNGIKAYGQNGSQIVGDEEKKIISLIQSNFKPWRKDYFSSRKEIFFNRNFKFGDVEDLRLSYSQCVKNIAKNYCNNLPWSSHVPIAYTPLHGIAATYIHDLFNMFDMPLLVDVANQAAPDPNFSTVKYPNPEEPITMRYACNFADQYDCMVVLANDPDGDRLGICEKIDGKWIMYTGNEIAAILGYLTFSMLTDKSDTKKKPDCKNIHMISTNISSRILESICNKEGMVHWETTAGFKWAGEKIKDIEHSGGKLLFAFEESMGYMIGSEISHEKDGIIPAVLVGLLVHNLYQKGKSLYNYLHEIYIRYGIHTNKTSYFTFEDQSQVVGIFERLVNNGDYIKNYGDRKVTWIRDLTGIHHKHGFDSKEENQISKMPVTSSSMLFTVELDNDTLISIRQSGTEKKLKYYVELIEKPRVTIQSLKDLSNELITSNEKLHSSIDIVIKEMIKPEEHGLNTQEV